MDHEANTNQTSVPSMDYRDGNFSADTTHIVYDPFSADLKTNNGVGRTASRAISFRQPHQPGIAQRSSP